MNPRSSDPIVQDDWQRFLQNFARKVTTLRFHIGPEDLVLPLVRMQRQNRHARSRTGTPSSDLVDTHWAGRLATMLGTYG